MAKKVVKAAKDWVPKRHRTIMGMPEWLVFTIVVLFAASVIAIYVLPAFSHHH